MFSSIPKNSFIVSRERPPLNPFLTRRELLLQSANGFGAMALLALSQRQAWGDDQQVACHFPPTAERVIFLYMDGGPSQVDTFDPKPMLDKKDGQDPGKLFEVSPTQFNNNGKLLKSPWTFQKYGESGIEVSSLFPHIAQHVDSMAIVRSMTSKFPEHTFANYFLHSGSGLQGRPSMGAWINYGLGSESDDLPGFVVLNGGLIPPGGLDCFGSGFLPATFQGSVLKPQGEAIANVRPFQETDRKQWQKLQLLKALDRATQQQFGEHDEIESAIANYEKAFRMQVAVPDVCNVEDETEETKRLYGLDHRYEMTRLFGRECLLARRLVERGVRFVELTCPNVGHDRWDQHNNLMEGHNQNALTVDQPIAALLTDLKRRGLLDTTLVVWAGEFGRTPFAQGANGRDHNPFGFSVWLAGGGIRGGVVYGETDEFGYRVVRDRVEMHDLHATMLHCLGLDHTRSTFRFGGRDMRLTDVHGNVIHGILG